MTDPEEYGAAPPRLQAWPVFLGAGVTLALVQALVPSAVVDTLASLVIGFGAGLAVVLGVRRHRLRATLPWYVLAAGLALWAIGGVPTPPALRDLSSAGEVFHLLGYVAVALALLGLARRQPGRNPGNWVEGLTVGAGLALIGFEALFRPTFEAEADPLDALVRVAPLVGGLVMVVGVVALATTPGGWNRSARILMGSVILVLLGDTVEAASALRAAESTAWTGLLWLSALAGFGAAALHPTMADLSRPASHTPGFSRRRLVFVALAAMIAPAMLAAEQLGALQTGGWSLVIGAVVLFALVLTRMAIALGQIAEADRARSELQQQLAYDAAHDPLTQLPNRGRGLALTRRALALDRGTGSSTAVLFIDLDGFKHVNDTLGHRAGDEVLRRVAERLREGIREEDHAIRHGGDEFVVLLQETPGSEAALAVARRLIEAISQPLMLAGHAAGVGASIGVALATGGTTNAARLVDEADQAAYVAKARGRGRAQLYDESMRRADDERQALEEELRAAVVGDQLLLHYQPVVDTRTGDVTGYEALVRWERPGHGLVPPGDFLPVAQESELICDLDAWVLEAAARQLVAWTETFAPERLRISVNLSPKHVARSRVVDDVERALQRSGLAPHRLVVETGEDVFSDVSGSVTHLRRLRALGVAVSIDDYGAGFGSLARLGELPVDTVKIDRQYLDIDSMQASRLLHLMIQGAHAVGLTAVAQGVEQDVQLATLRSLDCEAVQGFHIAAPMPPDQAADYFRDLEANRFAGLRVSGSTPEDRPR